MDHHAILTSDPTLRKRAWCVLLTGRPKYNLYFKVFSEIDFAIKILNKITIFLYTPAKYNLNFIDKISKER